MAAHPAWVGTVLSHSKASACSYRQENKPQKDHSVAQSSTLQYAAGGDVQKTALTLTPTLFCRTAPHLAQKTCTVDSKDEAGTAAVSQLDDNRAEKTCILSVKAVRSGERRKQ